MRKAHFPCVFPVLDAEVFLHGDFYKIPFKTMIYVLAFILLNPSGGELQWL